MKRTILAIGAILASGAAANASGYGDSIDRREHNQELRIEREVRDGSLTRREYNRLEAEQGRDIYRERHDGERRYWRSRWW